MLAPMVLVLLLVVAYPLADALWLSCTASISPIPSRASHSSAWAIISTPSDSGVLVFHLPHPLPLLSVALELALGLLFAVLLNERFQGNLGARLAMIFPWALLTVSNGVLWA